MKPIVLWMLLLVPVIGPSVAWAQGGAGGTGGIATAGGAAGVAGTAGAAGSEGGATTVTSGGIGGRSGSPRDEGCTCRHAPGDATSAWLLVAAFAGGAWRRRKRSRRS